MFLKVWYLGDIDFYGNYDALLCTDTMLAQPVVRCLRNTFGYEQCFHIFSSSEDTDP